MASNPIKRSSKDFEKKPVFDISEQAYDISNSLTQIISRRIKERNGEINFSEFMQMALYEPQLGYYQNNLQKLGAQGDFITAPEMGKLFAACLAGSLTKYSTGNSAENPSASNAGCPALRTGSILEIGAGSGRLASNLLAALTEASKLPNLYYILEPSAMLQSQQRKRLAKEIPHYLENISWLSELPKSFDGVIIANEVIDALPVDRIINQSNGWHWLNVSFSANRFTEVLGEKIPDCLLPNYLSCFGGKPIYPQGYQAETRKITRGWINALASSLNCGSIILIDYGYPQQELYHTQRAAGSLKCFINHHQHDDPFQYVGLQDITAHVDFTEVAISAQKSGLEVSGFTTQAGFLLENGITELAGTQKKQSAQSLSGTQAYSISRELQQLLMPGQMGEIIKVMLLTKNTDLLVSGFSLQDHLHRL